MYFSFGIPKMVTFFIQRSEDDSFWSYVARKSELSHSIRRSHNSELINNNDARQKAWLHYFPMFTSVKCQWQYLHTGDTSFYWYSRVTTTTSTNNAVRLLKFLIRNRQTCRLKANTHVFILDKALRTQCAIDIQRGGLIKKKNAISSSPSVRIGIILYFVWVYYKTRSMILYKRLSDNRLMFTSESARETR